jgi:hypothetical protein
MDVSALGPRSLADPDLPGSGLQMLHGADVSETSKSPSLIRQFSSRGLSFSKPINPAKGAMIQKVCYIDFFSLGF